jgi:hypothetical protein
MRPLFHKPLTRTQRVLHYAALAAAAVLIAVGQSGADEILAAWTTTRAAPAPEYASYGYREEPATTDTVARAVSASLAADDQACRDLHGDNASAQQRPDGSHRCVDKYGRRLSSRSAITIPAHRIAKAGTP